MKKRKRIQSLHANVFDKNAEKKGAYTHSYTCRPMQRNGYTY